MNKIALGTILTLAILGVGYIIYMSNDDMNREDVVDMAGKDMVKEEGEMDAGTTNMKDVMVAAGAYETYTPDKLMRAEEGQVVLFFRASWCPTCRALDSDIKASLEDIPDGVSILEIDYDTALDLRQKYGVTNQHTLVQVDATGTLMKKWSGGLTLETVLEQLI